MSDCENTAFREVNPHLLCSPFIRASWQPLTAALVPLTAHRVRVFLAHRDAVGRGASTPSLTEFQKQDLVYQ